MRADSRERERAPSELAQEQLRAPSGTNRSRAREDDEREKRKAYPKVVSRPRHQLPQSARDAAVVHLRAGARDVLVATDVAARGLDLPGVELVVHADPPKDADAYAHRAGRAGTAGVRGSAACRF